MSILDDITSVANGNASDIFTSLKTAFSQYVVSPLNAFGLGGFVFDIEGEATHRLEAEITDHYTEGNFATQDHISIKPKYITLHNYVGELVNRLDDDTNTPLQKLTQKLTVIDSYLPALTAGISQAKSILDDDQDSLNFNNILNDAVDIWGIYKNLNPPIPRQQQAYQFFQALQQQKILVAVQTPFEYCTNMAIMSVVAKQDEDTKFMSDFSITLKEIRVVQSQSASFDFKAQLQNLSITAAAQSASTVDGNKVQGVTDIDTIKLGSIFQ